MKPFMRTICGGLLLMVSVVLGSCGKDPASSTAEADEKDKDTAFLELYCSAIHATYPDAQRIASEEFGLVNMSIDIPTSEVAYQSIVFRNKIDFEDALRSALKSFMEDGEDYESPLGLIQNDFFCTPIEEQKEILFELLNRQDTYLELVSSDEGIGSAEGGESIKEDWIFYLRIRSYTDHLQWAIVDRSGKEPTYNYGFN